MILRYHKWHIPASIGLGTSPHDMLDEYRAAFGADIKDLFPVVDTEIGKLGTMTCHDGCTPEVSRALGYNGCEVICHPVALQEVEGVSAPWDFWRFTRRTRAHDNMAYLLGSNWGSGRLRLLPARLLSGQLHHHRLPGHGAARGPVPAGAGDRGDASTSSRCASTARAATTTPGWTCARRASGRSTTSRSTRPTSFPRARPPRTLSDKMGPVKQVFADIYGRGQFTPPAGMTVADMPKQHEQRVLEAQRIGTLRKS